MSLAARFTTFADLQMRTLRRSHVRHWVSSTVSRGSAPGTVHTRTDSVRAVLRGVADRVIPRDPSEGIALPRRRRAAAAMTLPTPAQVEAIPEAADGPFRAFVGLCGFAGLRLGEAAAVRVGDIDFLLRTEHRRPPLADDARRSRPHGREAARPPALLRLRAHRLRCDVVTVQRALGHASATTTLTTYSHLWPTAEDRTRRAAEELFADSCGPGADPATLTRR